VFKDHLANRQYGQMRDRGLISKTMGVVAGGPFEDKIEKIASVKLQGDNGLLEVATALYEALTAKGGDRKWETRPVFLLDYADRNVALIGITGAPIESRAFAIVGAGNDDSRSDLTCPGLDHAAAFPFAILLTRTGEEITIYMVDSMFRMKMYFEDAGKMKFAANMRMPGSIENEVRDKVEESLY
jgi:hypothetical protein